MTYVLVAVFKIVFTFLVGIFVVGAVVPISSNVPDIEGLQARPRDHACLWRSHKHLNIRYRLKSPTTIIQIQHTIIRNHHTTKVTPS